MYESNYSDFNTQCVIQMKLKSQMNEKVKRKTNFIQRRIQRRRMYF